MQVQRNERAITCNKMLGFRTRYCTPEHVQTFPIESASHISKECVWVRSGKPSRKLLALFQWNVMNTVIVSDSRGIADRRSVSKQCAILGHMDMKRLPTPIQKPIFGPGRKVGRTSKALQPRIPMKVTEYNANTQRTSQVRCSGALGCPHATIVHDYPLCRKCTPLGQRIRHPRQLPRLFERRPPI